MAPIEAGRVSSAFGPSDYNDAFGQPRIGGDTGATSFADAVRELRDDIEQVIQNGFDESGFVTAPNDWASQSPPWRGASVSDAMTEPSRSDLPDADKEAFVSRLSPLATNAARRLGILPDLLLAHAALESDWGRRPLRDTAGRDMHNLFGVKAGSNWRGDTADAMTTEYRNGAGVKTVQRFRVYPDDKSAIADYVHLLQTNPHFANARRTGNDAARFARALEQGGYATDPDYAGKLNRVAKDVAVQKAAERPAPDGQPSETSND